jgi:hypothetical protein
LPTPTYTALANVTLGTATASVTLSSIPATYRDLVLVFNGTLTTNTGVIVRNNGDSGSNYPQVLMRNDGASGTFSSTDTGTSYYATWNAAPSGTPIAFILQLMDYSATDKHKTALWRNQYEAFGATSRVEAFAGRWANTAAITSVAVVAAMASGTTVTLYGIEA